MTATIRTRIVLGIALTAASIVAVGLIWPLANTAAITYTYDDNAKVVVATTEPTLTLLTLEGTKRSREALSVTVTNDTNNALDTIRTTNQDTTTITLDTGELAERQHTLTIALTNQPPHTINVLIDRTPPPLVLTKPTQGHIGGETLVVAGTSEADATITIGEQNVTTTSAGTFELTVGPHTSDTLSVTARDVAGNETTVTTPLVVIPSRVENTDIRALHVSFHAWGDPVRRERIDALLDGGIVNAIQFDLKDESGHLGHRSDVAFANDTGAALNLYELRDVVAELHARDIAVIGRIVAFADPIVARYAYATNQRDLAIQTPTGQLYTGNYQGFTNFTHPTIINYTIDLALEAAAAGVDHILWDYLRRPDGRVSSIVIPGLSGSVEDAIVAFTATADEALYPWRIQHGASLYGISADRPREIGQDVARLRDHLDYVAPMIYPSHWGPGEYGVADPNRQPQQIVKATLNVWLNATANSRARVIPWLEDTSYRAYDRPFHVREQHRGTYAVGITEWLMWDAGSRFTPVAYDVAPPS